MRILAIHNAVVPIASEIRNAYISFAKMTVSVVAVVSDVERNGKPLIGYGFNSNGRYDQLGLLSRRFIPRLLEADPKSLLDDQRDNLDPHRAWKAMMADEKPGGHGERSVAVGVLDMALWDLAAKVEDKPLCQLLAERYRNGEADESVWVYAAGGYYYPGKDVPQLVDEMKRYVDLGYESVKIKIGGAPLAADLKRIDAVLAAIGPHAKARPSTPTDDSTAKPRSTTPKPSRPIRCCGTRSPATRSTMRSTPRWPTPRKSRSRPEKTCSPTKTPATCFATAACGGNATGSRWTRR